MFLFLTASFVVPCLLSFCLLFRLFDLHAADSSDSTCSYHVTQADYAAYATFASETAAAINMSFVIDLNFGFSADPNDEAVPEVKYLLSEHSLKNYVKVFNNRMFMDLPQH